MKINNLSILYTYKRNQFTNMAKGNNSQQKDKKKPKKGVK